MAEPIRWVPHHDGEYVVLHGHVESDGGIYSILRAWRDHRKLLCRFAPNGYDDLFSRNIVYISLLCRGTIGWREETHMCSTIEEAKALCQRHSELLMLQ